MKTRTAFQNGNRFETVLPEADKKLWFRMLIGEDEAQLAKVQRNRRDVDLLDVLNLRIVEIEGVDPKERKRFINDLSMGDADFLLDEFYRVDCGPETAIEIECPHCLAVQEIELPFESTFLMPGRGRALRRGRGSSFPR